MILASEATEITWVVVGGLVVAVLFICIAYVFGRGDG